MSGCGMTRMLLNGRVSDYLKGTGIKVLDRDWEHDGGTLAFVGTERNALVVVLPSVRSMSPDVPRIVVRRARLLAVEWMSQHGVRFDQVRVDHVAVIDDGPGGFTIDHVRSIG